MAEEDTATFSVRLPESLLAEIDRVAAREVRNRSQTVVWLLRSALALDARNATLAKARVGRVG
jgi:metal-responsive CopG/Arc/MetJ family transcriptional regulator